MKADGGVGSKMKIAEAQLKMAGDDASDHLLPVCRARLSPMIGSMFTAYAGTAQAAIPMHGSVRASMDAVGV